MGSDSGHHSGVSGVGEGFLARIVTAPAAAALPWSGGGGGMIGFVKRLFRDDAAAEEVRFLELRVIALDAENGRLRATLERVAALTQEGR